MIFFQLRNAHFFADKGYDVKAIYNAVKDIYHGECFIPINKRNTKNPKKLSTGHPICEAGLAMHKDGKFSDNGRTRQKYCCPFKRSKSGCCPCNHKNWNNGKKLAVVLNMSRFPMITDFPLTVNVFRSRRFMHSEQRLSVTTLVSSRPVRNVFGCIALMLHKTLILLLILLCSLSLTQLLSLNSKALIAVLNPLSVLLDELF